MKRTTTLVANTSNMPVGACEASIYTGRNISASAGRDNSMVNWLWPSLRHHNEDRTIMQTIHIDISRFEVMAQLYLQDWSKNNALVNLCLCLQGGCARIISLICKVLSTISNTYKQFMA